MILWLSYDFIAGLSIGSVGGTLFTLWRHRKVIL